MTTWAFPLSKIVENTAIPDHFPDQGEGEIFPDKFPRLGVVGSEKNSLSRHFWLFPPLKSKTDQIFPHLCQSFAPFLRGFPPPLASWHLVGQGQVDLVDTQSAVDFFKRSTSRSAVTSRVEGSFRCPQPYRSVYRSTRTTNCDTESKAGKLYIGTASVCVLCCAVLCCVVLCPPWLPGTW